LIKANSLKQTARAIFNAGIQAVAPEACMGRYLTISGSLLQVAETEFDLDDLLITGPTRTNVMDMQILLVST